MSLNQDQRDKLTAEAKRRGLDADKLIAAAEKQSTNDAKAGKDAGRKPAAAPADKAEDTTKPLYMYHLPFVTVNEVRETWLGLAPIAGGEANAAKYAAEQTAAAPVDKLPADSSGE